MRQREEESFTESLAMKVLQRFRSGRKRFSKASKEKMLHSDPTTPSDTSSVSSWGNESSIYSLAHCASDGISDAVTEASSLCPQVDDLHGDSPSDYGRCSRSRSHRGSNTTLVIHRQHAPTHALPDSIGTWLHAADALVRSREMQDLLHSSRDLALSALITSGNVALSAGGLVLDAALLPITLPLHIASAATGIVTSVAACVVNKAIGRENHSGEEQQQVESPIDGFIHSVVHFVPFLMNTAGRLTHEVGSAVLGIQEEKAKQPRQTPLRAIKESSSGELTSEREEMLLRLRLDLKIPSQGRQIPEKAFSRATPSDISKFLLRVDDIAVIVSPNPAAAKGVSPRRALFVDVGTDFADDSITSDALNQLIERGLRVSATNAGAHMHLPYVQCIKSIPVEWKPERDTASLTRKLSQLDQASFFTKLNHNVLVWSGKYGGPKYYGSENPLFLARGVVRKSPREFFEMLWDSDRTSEYNNFSLGRSDTLVIDDSISSSGDSGAKVIKSDTRVPFAGINISLCALMHAKKLKEGKYEGFVIVSRSLSSGMAGCHVGSCKHVGKNNKNEILLGVNVMRPVPGHPDLCDLISVSQVSSSMVPQFLAFRIGMMGLEDFFANVRKP